MMSLTPGEVGAEGRLQHKQYLSCQSKWDNYVV